jgi:hypothetical protein
MVYRQLVETKKHILSSYLSDSAVTVITADRILQYNTNNGQLISQTNIKATGLEGFTSFADTSKTCILQKANGYASLKTMYPNDLFLVNNQTSRIIQTTSSLKPIKTFEANDIWQIYHHTNQTQFLRNNSTTLLYKNGIRIGTLNGTEADFFSPTILIDKGRYHITIADISGTGH